MSSIASIDNNQYINNNATIIIITTLVPSCQLIIILLNNTINNLPRGCAISTIFLGCSSCNALKFYCRSLCFFWWHLRLYLICIPTLLNNSLLLWYRHVLYEIPPYPTYRMIHIHIQPNTEQVISHIAYLTIPNTE